MTEHNSDEVMEPWQPEVGDRVRLRLSLECELKCGAHSPAYQNGILKGHEAQMAANGKTGTVAWATDYWQQIQAQYNHYTIRMDSAYEYGGETFNGAFAAAIELEPLDKSKLAEGLVR